MLSLNDSQMGSVRQAAALLAPPRRDAFLRAVANFLPEHPTDFQVLAAVLSVLETEGISAGPQALAESLRETVRKEKSDVTATPTSQRRRQRQRFSNGERPSGFERRCAFSRSH
jgi:hypothetical protein